MLSQRIASAIVLLLILGAAAYLGGWWYFGIVIVAGVLGVYEFNTVLRHAGFVPWQPLLYALPLTLVLAAQFLRLTLEAPILAAALIAVSAWQLSLPDNKRSLPNWALTVVPGLYLGWLGADALLIRSAPQGWQWTLFLFLIVFATDTAAYFGGRAFGRSPFAPTISPKKTWEGALIGWAYATFLAVGLARFLQLPVPPVAALLLGLVTSVVSTIGDLTMSYVKRQGHVKDASHLIPGHGGILDRLDSILPAAAVVYTYIAFFLP